MECARLLLSTPHPCRVDRLGLSCPASRDLHRANDARGCSSITFSGSHVVPTQRINERAKHKLWGAGSGISLRAPEYRSQLASHLPVAQCSLTGPSVPCSSIPPIFPQGLIQIGFTLCLTARWHDVLSPALKRRFGVHYEQRGRTTVRHSSVENSKAIGDNDNGYTTFSETNDGASWTPSPSDTEPEIETRPLAFSAASSSSLETEESQSLVDNKEDSPNSGREERTFTTASGASGGFQSYKAWLIDGYANGSTPGGAGREKGEGQASIAGTYGTAEATAFAKEPLYQVLEVNLVGEVRKVEVSRRQLLKSSGLRQRDVRRVDPLLWVTNSLPAILIRDNAILLNLGSLRAIATRESVLIFDYLSIGAQTFLETLLQRLQMDTEVRKTSDAPCMPFELEVVEAALISRTQRLENALQDVEPRVMALLEELPNSLSADALEELRLSKQALVELGAKAGALRQMLLELLDQDNTADLRRMSAISSPSCHVNKADGALVCDTVGERQHAEEEEQEVEMLLEYYLQRCDSCNGQAEKLLDSAKEMEDSIGVNLSARRLEVSRLELLLQVGTFAAALGALVAGIFGMNLRSKLEGSVGAFYLTAGAILLGGVLLFIAMFAYLRQRRIL
eukprot:TRINITY_DN21103_c0_g1_i1.p1 TRINITY_DN21103_c0_g1~~TRINITY_DN21103_c0_g1_i1.p1  ORF type:complete len:623 (-),score=85.43 TRINITY_DN21103_c0_g1_i1:438-2306(-)